jgi:hypothetical protein
MTHNQQSAAVGAYSYAARPCSMGLTERTLEEGEYGNDDATAYYAEPQQSIQTVSSTLYRPQAARQYWQVYLRDVA